MPTFNPYVDTYSIKKYAFLHHFLPHPETKKRAKLLSPKALIAYSFIMLVIIALFRLVPVVAPGVLGYASNIYYGDLLSNTNRVRQEHGLSTLRSSEILNEAARKKAEHMFANNYWAHVAPDGTAPWDFILNEGYDYSYAGENLAKNFNTSKQVVEAWFDSPSHRENLLNSNYDEIGFAVVNGVLDGYETTLVVQMFGKPRQPSFVAEVPQVAETPQAQQTPEIVNIPSSEIFFGDEVEIAPTPQVLPAIDVTLASKTISMLIGGFLLVLLLLDIWYTEKKAIPKVTGHAFSHVILLVVVLVGVWFVLSPGKIL